MSPSTGVNIGRTDLLRTVRKIRLVLTNTLPSTNDNEMTTDIHGHDLVLNLLRLINQ